MAKASRRPNASRNRVHAHAEVTWLGARFQLPNYVLEDEPYRPDLVLWMEQPSGLIVGSDVVPPDSAWPLASALRKALERPTRGAAKQPDRLRVADPVAETELRQAFRNRFGIDVAPTPELDDVFQHFLENGPKGEGDASYLEGGRIPESTVARMFEAAGTLYRAAPWRTASDDEVLRMDIPALSVEGACVSIIGALGESLGIIVFPSLLGYERFGAAAEQAADGGPLDMGGPVLSLDFWKTPDLPPKMRREIVQHGWTALAPDAVPVVGLRDRDGVPRPLCKRDVEIATECAFAVASFFLRHASAFGGRGHDPVCESSTMDDTGVTVTLTLPYDAVELFDTAPAETSVARVKVGRNDPCPCGSDKKYKKCCLDKVQSAKVEDRRRAAAHELDERMAWTLRNFASERFGAAWDSACDKLVRAAGGETPLLQALSVPWSVYEARVDGKRIVDVFATECGRRLAREERDWLATQRTALLSIWEVTSCEPGAAVHVRSLLSGEVRRVREVKGSRTLVARDAILARVVDHEGASYFYGVYPRMLPPDAAARVVNAAKRRAKTTGASVEKPDEDLGLVMVRAWTKAIREAEEEAARPRQLVNTDGEAFVLTTDHFEFDAAAQSEIEARLREFKGIEAPGEEDGEYTVLKAGNAMHRHWDNTVIGRFTVDTGRLRLETNSVERADELRARIEAACGGLLKHRLREHADPMSSARPPRGAARTPVPPPEAQAALLELKSKHYEQWLDEPLPALSGKTPRQAVRSKRGREQVDVLLRTMENHEQRGGGSPFDFRPLRRKLRLDLPEETGERRHLRPGIDAES
jgi:hypothetical protein